MSLEARFHKSCFDEIAIIEDGKIYLNYLTANKITWFDMSPDAGDPNCICSWCSNIIEEDEIPIRFFNEGQAR